MAGYTQFPGREMVELHQQTIEYGRTLIATRSPTALVSDPPPPAWTPFRAYLPEALDYVVPSAPSECISGGLVVGCILDERCGERTYLDSEIAIFRVAGSVSSAYGTPVFMKKREHILQCWESTWKNAASLVLIQAEGFPAKTVEYNHPIKYAVLDHFRVSLIWCEENEDGELVYMVRLEKCDLQTKSWWTPRQPDPPTAREFLGQHGPFVSDPCSGCGKQSPRVYNEALLCTNKDCPQFFTVIGQGNLDVAAPAELTFDDGFLMYRSYIGSAQRPAFPLVRNLLYDLNTLSTSALSHSRMLCRGIVCDRCRSIVPKVYWHIWKCEECPPSTALAISCDPGRIDLEAVVPRTFVSYQGHPPLNFDVTNDFGVRINKQYKDLYMIDQWTLHAGCQLIVFSPTRNFNERERGPNSVFHNVLADANSGALKLHRYKDQDPPTLDDHFQSNWGAEFGYSGFQESAPFLQAPVSVSVARGLLDEVGRAEVRNYSESNAVQVFGFMQDMGLQWHTDGEGELGDSASFLNLGGDSIFKFRLQKAHYTNEKAFGPGGEVVRGAQNWEKALKIKEMAARGKRPADSELFEFSHGLPGPAQPEAQIPLIHGSIVIMQGKLFSKYYEHNLTTSGPLTFAVAARAIDEQRHQGLLKTKYAVNSERPNGQLFTSNLDDPGEVDDSPSPEPHIPIPIVIHQPNRPQPAPAQRYPLLAPAHSRSPSNGSQASSGSDNFKWTQEMKDRLFYLKETEGLTHREIKEQEGWNVPVTSMTTMLFRERNRRAAAGTYTPPSPNGSSGSRQRRVPRPATHAWDSRAAWSQQELDQLWELRNRDPPVPYDEITTMYDGRRTAKAYREQFSLEKKRRQGQPTRNDQPNTQLTGTTVLATRERVERAGDQAQPDTLAPIQLLLNPVDDAHTVPAIRTQYQTQNIVDLTATSPTPEDEVDLPLRQTQGSGYGERS